MSNSAKLGVAAASLAAAATMIGAAPAAAGEVCDKCVDGPDAVDPFHKVDDAFDVLLPAVQADVFFKIGDTKGEVLDHLEDVFNKQR